MRMYVVVNKDMGKKIRKRGMTKSYQHVQASHAVAEFMRGHPKTSWINGTLIVLGVSNRQFNYYFSKIFNNITKYPASRFWEPDLDGETTAFATVLREEDYGIFKRLELL